MATRFTTSVLMVLGLAACAGKAQDAAPAKDLPDGLREHVRTETFRPVAKVGDLPASVRAGLAQLFGETLKMAEPGAPFQATDVMGPERLPFRRLVAAGCSADHCLVHYEKGGFAHLYYVVVFETGAADAKSAKLAWGGATGGGLANVDAVKDALVSGKVVAQPTPKYW
jgi:hypothetical protein